MGKKIAPENKKLFKKQEAFVEYYLQNGYNATQAAKSAGYAGGYGTLRGIGSENLTKPNIAKRISQRFEDISMGANEVLERVGKMARGFDIADYTKLKEIYAINDDGDEYLTGHDLWIDFYKLQADGFSHLIKQVKQTNSGIDIKWHDQMKALELIGKHHKLFTDKMEVTDADGKPLFPLTQVVKQLQGIDKKSDN